MSILVPPSLQKKSIINLHVNLSYFFHTFLSPLSNFSLPKRNTSFFRKRSPSHTTLIRLYWPVCRIHGSQVNIQIFPISLCVGLCSVLAVHRPIVLMCFYAL